MPALPVRVLPALAALMLVGAQPAVEFEPRTAVGVGSAWQEDARWHMTGHTRATLGRVPVRNKVDDDGVHYEVRVRVDEVSEGRPSSLSYAFTDAGRVEQGKPEGVELAGLDVVAAGLGKDRSFKRGDGKRLKRKARGFMEEQFRDPGDRPDPVELLLPGKPVGPGDSWDIDMSSITEQLGSDRFTMDLAASHARATLESLPERDGVRFGRIAYDILIVPASIKDAEFSEARMTLRGAVELPLQGDDPSRVLELELVTRFDGSFKRKGVRFHLDLDHTTVGVERREAAQ